jgi:peptidoglycan/LPS O-acetylase OafA/YrhL
MMQTIIPTTVISPVLPIKRFEYDLEGLRGFAAILVLWCHAIGMPKFLDPGWNPEGIAGYQPPAHFCVLIFFVLSGYVIGMSTKGSLTLLGILPYLRKRFTRIYPIYFISIVFTIIIANQVFPFRTIIGNLTFLQIIITPLIEANGASWSLQYEIIYYLLFIPLSFCAINPLAAAGTILAFGLGVFHFLPNVPLPASYAFGFTFWCCGWALARYSATWPRLQTSYSLLASALLLFFSLRNFNTLDPLLSVVFTRVLGNDLVYNPGLNLFESMIAIHDFTYLPYALLGILLFVHKDFPARRLVIGVLYLLPLISFSYLANHWPDYNHSKLVLPAISYLLALGLLLRPTAWTEKVGRVLMVWLIKLGAWSYGLYIIHVPILWCFKQIAYFSGSAFTYWVRFSIFIALVLVAAYFLEEKVQPYMKNKVLKKTAKGLTE